MESSEESLAGSHEPGFQGFVSGCMAQPTSQRAYQVDGPSFPSALRPAFLCTSITLAFVPSPNRPSALLPASACHFLRPYDPEDLPDPKISPGTRLFGTLPVTDVCFLSSP